MVRRQVVVLVFSMLLALTGHAFAASHGGGGGGRGGGGGGRGGGGGPGGGGGNGPGGGGMNGRNGDNSNTDERTLDWQDSYDTALDFAGHGPRPVCAVIARDGNAADKKLVELMAAWPVIDDMSKKDLAFVWMPDTTPRGKELIGQFKIKTFPYIVWLDQYGNALAGQSFPDSASAIQSVVQSWKATIDNVTKFLTERVAHADKLAAKGKLREAYQEYSIVAPFKGPQPDLARVGRDKVLESWRKLVALAATLPATSRERAGVLKGLQKDTAGLDCAKLISAEIAAAEKPKADAPAADKPGAPGAAVAAATESADSKAATVETSATAAVPPPAEVKPLKSLASGPLNLERESDDSNFDTHLLSESTDEHLKSADKLLKAGLVAYKQALADSMDRGEARNALLKKAHDLFDQSIQAIDTVNVAKPNAQLDRVMAQISMLMYGCLKYQTL